MLPGFSSIPYCFLMFPPSLLRKSVLYWMHPIHRGDFMTVNQIIMYFLAFGAALGGIDQMLGNRFGYGEKFEAGFRMLGPVALSMAGIICLAPLLSSLLGVFIRPVCAVLNMDPGIFGSILAIDMGGCQLAAELATDPEFGKFSGVVVSSIFGCTVVFSIPVGLGFVHESDRPYFTRGILIGLATMPVSITVGALTLGQSLGYILWNCLPVLLISLFLAIGVIAKPEAMMLHFQRFAKAVKNLAILGLMLAAFSYLSEVTLIPSLLPLPDAMETVTSICISMLGSMPLAELLQRLLKVPFQKINEKAGLNGATTTALLLGLVSATPALAMIPQMNRRGQVVASACLVSCICSFGAHFAFANSLYPDMVVPMLAAKLTGGLLGGVIAMLFTQNLKETE